MDTNTAPAATPPVQRAAEMAASLHYNVTPKTHHLYNVIMTSGIAEVLNFNAEKTKPISMDVRDIFDAAAKSNDVEYAKEVLSRVNSRDIEYIIPIVVGLGHLDMVKLLFDALHAPLAEPEVVHPYRGCNFSILLRNAYMSRNAEMQNYILQLAKDGFDDSAFKESFAHGILMMNIHDFKVNGHPYCIYSDAILSADKDIIALALKFLFDGDVSKISHHCKRAILVKACFTNDVEIIKYVMGECKIDPSYFNEIFYGVSTHINNETLKFLLNYIDFDVVMKDGEFNIEHILRHGDLELVKNFMRHVDITPFSECIDREDIFNEIKDRLKEPERSNTEFRIACKLGRYEDVDRLIDKVDPELLLYSLTLAYESGCIKTVKRIYWHIIDIDKINISFSALSLETEEMIKFAIEDKLHILFSLLNLGNEAMVKFAIDQIKNRMHY
jgi:hypothetical protein